MIKALSVRAEPFLCGSPSRDLKWFCILEIDSDFVMRIKFAEIFIKNQEMYSKFIDELEIWSYIHEHETDC